MCCNRRFGLNQTKSPRKHDFLWKYAQIYVWQCTPNLRLSSCDCWKITNHKKSRLNHPTQARTFLNGQIFSGTVVTSPRSWKVYSFLRVVVWPGSRDVVLLMAKHSNLKENVPVVQCAIIEGANTVESLEIAWVNINAYTPATNNTCLDDSVSVKRLQIQFPHTQTKDFCHYSDRPCTTFDLWSTYYVSSGPLRCIGSSRKCIGVCGYQNMSSPAMKTSHQSPQSMHPADTVKFHECKGISLAPFHYSELSQTWPLCPLLRGLWRYESSLPAQTNAYWRRFIWASGQSAEFPLATFVITLNKQPLSPPVHEAFRRWTEENSRVSEYLGQHGILDLSENTRLSLSPSLTHSHKHTTTHTPHTHTVVVNTQLACSRVQMVYNLQPSKRNWAAPVSWNLSPSSCFKC